MLDSPWVGAILLFVVSAVASLWWETREPRRVLAALRAAIATAFVLQLLLQPLSILRSGRIDGPFLFVGLFVSIVYSWLVSIAVISLRRWLRQSVPS